MNLGDRELGIGEDKGAMGKRNNFGGKTVSSETLAENLFVFIERGFELLFQPLSPLHHHLLS